MYKATLPPEGHHVLNIGFGLEHGDILEDIKRVADEYRTGLGQTTVRGLVKAAIRQDIYNDVFLKDPEDPYATVTMSQKERYASTHLHYKRISDFMLYEVHDKTGMDYAKFSTLPTYMVEFILKQLRQASQEQISNSNKAKDKIEDIAGSVGFPNMKKRK